MFRLVYGLDIFIGFGTNGRDVLSAILNTSFLERIREFRIVAGWHRVRGALKAGLDKVYCKVVNGSRDELFKIALSENDKNGLAMNAADLRHCIIKVQELHPDWNPQAVVLFLGKGSPSYAARIETEQKELGQSVLPEKRLGKDGKLYPTEKKNAAKPAKPSKPLHDTLDSGVTQNSKENSHVEMSDPHGDRPVQIPEQDNLAMLFDGWEDRPSRMIHILDTCEEHSATNEEKSALYEKVKRWVGRRVNLTHAQDREFVS